MTRTLTTTRWGSKGERQWKETKLSEGEENFHRGGRKRGGAGEEEEGETGGPVKNFFLYRLGFFPLLRNEGEALYNG